MIKHATIDELFNIRKGRKMNEVAIADDSSISKVRYLQIEDLRDANNLKYCEAKEDAIIVSSKDIVIAWDGANAGTSNFGLEGAIGSTLARLSPKKDGLFIPYVGRFLQFNEPYLRATCTGATIPHVHRQSLEDLVVPLPSLEMQKKIIITLDQAQELINKRKQQIELLDEFLQSVFLDMFGDPVHNSKGWHIAKLSELGELQRGKSTHRPRNDPLLLGGPYPLIQTGDVSKPGLYIEDYSQTYSEFGLAQSKMWSAGTLCITIAANIAKTGILTFDACFPDSVVAFLPKERTNSHFIQFWFIFLQEIIEANAPVSAQKNINLRILRGLDVICPPIKLQEEFAKIVEKTETVRNSMTEGLKELQNLFNSLMQRAFKGELFS